MAETVYQARRRFYLLRFRRSRNPDTLEKMYESSGRIWDKIPPHVWQYVK